MMQLSRTYDELLHSVSRELYKLDTGRKQIESAQENYDETEFEIDEIKGEINSLDMRLETIKLELSYLRDSLTQKDIAGITMYIDQWISNYTTENSEPLFWYRGDTARSYICTATVLPTGSVVVSFIAKLHGVADPVRLEFIY